LAPKIVKKEKDQEHLKSKSHEKDNVNIGFNDGCSDLCTRQQLLL
jgi:hypothetical protein